MSESVNELQARMEKTKAEREKLQNQINAMTAQLTQVVDSTQTWQQKQKEISCKYIYSTIVHLEENINSLLFVTADLQKDYLAMKELEQLIEETETSFNKINESIKTLICVVS